MAKTSKMFAMTVDADVESGLFVTVFRAPFHPGSCRNEAGHQFNNDHYYKLSKYSLERARRVQDRLLEEYDSSQLVIIQRENFIERVNTDDSLFSALCEVDSDGLKAIEDEQHFFLYGA